jgi:hypothetical protein
VFSDECSEMKKQALKILLGFGEAKRRTLHRRPQPNMRVQ